MLSSSATATTVSHKASGELLADKILVVQSPLESGDHRGGIDELRWTILCDAVAAAHEGQPAAARAAWTRLETDVPVDGQTAGYLWYLLRYRIADYLGRRPSEQDLAALARDGHPRYARVVRGDVQELEDLLRTLFNTVSEEHRITGGRFVVLGIVTLGVLLDDPYRQLAQLKPHLNDWWVRRGRHLVGAADRARDHDQPAS